jgi:hypothetical protein
MTYGGKEVVNTIKFINAKGAEGKNDKPKELRVLRGEKLLTLRAPSGLLKVEVGDVVSPK